MKPAAENEVHELVRRQRYHHQSEFQWRAQRRDTFVVQSEEIHQYSERSDTIIKQSGDSRPVDRTPLDLSASLTTSTTNSVHNETDEIIPEDDEETRDELCLIFSDEKKEKVRVSTIVKGILARVLFLVHSLTVVATSRKFFPLRQIFLLIPWIIYVVLVIPETVISYSYRQFTQWRWICPSVLLYTLVTVPMIWILELTNTRERTKLGKGKCLEFYGNCFQTNHTPPWSNMAANQPDIPPYDTNMSHHTSPSMNQSANEPYMPPYDISISELSMIHQQCMVFLILLGRWLLPKNQFNRLELAQLLLIFVGSGEDIVEFSTETLAVTSVGCDYTLVVVILMFWTLSISQFSIGLPPKTKKTTKSSTAIEQPTMTTFGQLYGHDEIAKIAIERRQSMMKLNNRLSKISIKGGINNLETVAEVTTNNEESAVPEEQGKIYGKTRRTLRLPKPKISEEQQTHFKFLYALYRKEVREALLTILLQDFPFLVIRIYVLTIAPLQTSVMFYGLKNIFVIGLHFYRFYALYLEYRKQLRIAPIKEEPPHSSSDGTVKEGAEDGTQRNTNSRRESKSKYELSGSKNCGEK